MLAVGPLVVVVVVVVATRGSSTVAHAASIVPMATPASKRIVIDNSPCSPGGWAKEWCKALGLADHLVRLRPGSTAQRKSRHCFIGGAAAPQAAFEQEIGRAHV